MTEQMPSTACCRKCGYAVVGAAANTCPECGSTIDPADPRTFDQSPRARAWRRRRRLLLIGAGIVTVILAIAPRDYIRASITYNAEKGLPQERITRWLLVPPRWVARVPYPRWTSSEQGVGLVEQDWGPGTCNGLATFRTILRRTSLLTLSNDPDEGGAAWVPGSDVDPSLRGSITREWAIEELNTTIDRKIRQVHGPRPLPTADY